MHLGVYDAILHDRDLPAAIEVVRDLGLTGIELNTGGFLPAAHIPSFDEILESEAARDDFLATSPAPGSRSQASTATATPCIRTPSSVTPTRTTSADRSASPIA